MILLAVAPTAVSQDPALITAIFTGIAVVITALGGIIVQLYVASKTTSKKLDTVIKLTNGGKTELLEEIATVKTLLAQESGRKGDQIRADAATKNLVAHEAVVQSIPPGDLKK